MTNDHSRPTQFPFDNSNPMEDQSKGLAMKPSIKERKLNVLPLLGAIFTCSTAGTDVELLLKEKYETC